MMSKTSINNQHMNVLRKVIEAGYTDDKTITGLSTEDMLAFCKSIADISAVVELQKAVKANRLISFLAGENKVKDDTNE